MRKFLLRIFPLILIVLFFTGMKYAGGDEKNKGKMQKITTNDLQDNIAINQINMMFYNNGCGSYNRAGSGSSGLYWPGGINAVQTAIFEDGLLFGGRVGSEVRVGGDTYRYGLQAGSILPNGNAALASLDRYKIWKIRKGWESLPDGTEKSRLKNDYENWPVEDGAPWVDKNNNGTFERGIDEPQFIGDEVNWMVMNDLDESRTTFLYGTQPMGLEVQCTIFGFNKTGALGDMVFKKYKVINKGTKVIRDACLAYWSDPDLGDANDDFVGCDTLLKIGYVYNGDNFDGGANGYGTPPPAAAYVFFQGPRIPYDPVKYPVITQKNLPDSAKFDWKWMHGYTNLPMTSFSFYINGSTIYSDPDLGVPAGSVQMYNYMNSRLWDGQPFIDPHTGQAVNYCLAGDPVNGTGWYEGAGWPGGQAPGDRRIAMSAGPFNLSPGDTQEVVVGIVLAKGTDNINSIKVLKETVVKAQTAYDNNFNLVPNPPHPFVTMNPLDKQIVFYWENNAESYHAVDPLIGNMPDNSYDFEGYEIYQYSDIRGTNPTLLATYDLVNGIKSVEDYQTVGGKQVLLPVVNGTDNGIRRIFQVTSDKIKQLPLYNGTSYFFGVVAYGYCPYGDPKILKTTHAPIEVRPQEIPVGSAIPYGYGQSFTVARSTDLNDGVVSTFVVDPNKLTGHTYKVNIDTSAGVTCWSLKDMNTGVTLLTKQPFSTLTSSGYDYLADASVVDGFIVKVADPGTSTNKIREVSMVQDGTTPVTGTGTILPGITRLGVNVFGSTTKTALRRWWVTAFDSAGGAYTQGLQSLNHKSKMGDYDYEIRFDGNTSEFYPYYQSGITMSYMKQNTYKGKNTLPFSVYRLKRSDQPGTVDKRLVPKIYDGKYLWRTGVRDSAWGYEWVNRARLVYDSIAYEEVLVMDSTYTSPLPSTMRATTDVDYRIKFAFMADTTNALPKPGTIIRVIIWKPVRLNDSFTFTATKPTKNSPELAKNALGRISVYPNPYFGAHAQELDKYQRFVRFTNLPQKATIRIFTLAGVFVAKIDKDDASPYCDWNLLNTNNIPVASGMFLAYIDIPDVGSTVLKIAVIQETPYIDRL